MVSGYAVHFMLGRLLGPSQYGVFGIVLSLVMASNALLVSGIPSAVSKFVSEDNGRSAIVMKEALKIEVVFSFFIFSLYFELAGVIASALGDMSLVPYIRASAFILPAYALYSLYSGALNGLQFLGKQAGVSIAYSMVKVASILALVLMGFGIYGAIFGYFFGPLVGLLIARHYLSGAAGRFAGVSGAHFEAGKGGLRHGAHFEGERGRGAVGPKAHFEGGLQPHASFDSRKIVDFAVPVILFSVAANLLMSIDLFSIKAILGDDTLAGYYNAATTLGRVPYFLLTVLGGALFPAISAVVAKGDLDKARGLLGESVRYLVLLAVPAALVMGATSSGLLGLFYSSRYLGGAQSLSILAISFAFLAFFSIFTSALNAAGKPKLPFAIGFLMVGLDVVLNRLFIPVYGIEGAALASTVSVFFGMVLSGAWVWRIFGDFVGWKTVARAGIAGAFIFWVSGLVEVSRYLLPIEYGVLFAVYLGLLALLGEIQKRDFELILSMIPKKFLRGACSAWIFLSSVTNSK